MKNFIVITEQGRTRGKTTGDLYQIKNNKPVRISSFGFSTQLNKGIKHEAVKALTTFGALPRNKINKQGYINFEKQDYNVLIIEGRGLNYIELL